MSETIQQQLDAKDKEIEALKREIKELQSYIRKELSNENPPAIGPPVPIRLHSDNSPEG